MKKMDLTDKKKIFTGKRVFAASCALAVLITSTSVSMAAGHTIKSQGRIVFKNNTEDTSDDVVFDATDLYFLEAEISDATADMTEGKALLIENLKTKLPESDTADLTPDSPMSEIANTITLIGNGTDFTATDLLEGKKAYNGTQVIEGTMPDNGSVMPDALAAGESYVIPYGYHSGSGVVITKSLASQTGVSGTYTNDQGTEDTADDTQDLLTGATADNLSLGVAAWVNGEYIIGNGADVDAAYTQGYTDGFSKLQESATIEYVYHQHTGSSSRNGGCYTKGSHEHTDSCSKGFASYCECTVGHDYPALYACDSCHHNHDNNEKCGAGIGEQIYTCGSPLNKWSLGCGKTTKTIESATVSFE